MSSSAKLLGRSGVIMREIFEVTSGITSESGDVCVSLSGDVCVSLSGDVCVSLSGDVCVSLSGDVCKLGSRVPGEMTLD
ncbi:MAG: hypothetical protein AB7V56_16025 [Candidatus Nitrosocosmicus sp.]|nr:hypothetical protein F1Z66_11795 [Candidatus Nitrosocosmicus sp. SS]